MVPNLGAMPVEVREQVEQDRRRQCRVIACNTVIALVEHQQVKFNGTNGDVIAEFRSLVDEIAGWVERGV